MKLSLFLFLFAAFTARAEFVIQDPNNILAAADAFLGERSFDQAYQCGDNAVYQYNSCIIICSPDMTCVPQTCSPYHSVQEVSFCHEDFVHVDYISGEHAWTSVYKREQYEKSTGNPLRNIYPAVAVAVPEGNVSTQPDRIYLPEPKLKGNLRAMKSSPSTLKFESTEYGSKEIMGKSIPTMKVSYEITSCYITTIPENEKSKEEEVCVSWKDYLTIGHGLSGLATTVQSGGVNGDGVEQIWEELVSFQ